MKPPPDVSSPIDLRNMEDAREWAHTAIVKRPSRPEFFEMFAALIHDHNQMVSTILELGSGPGFLAEHLLRRLPNVEYVALDFSGAMHELARSRLGELASRVKFIERSFKDEKWMERLGQFDCVVTHQAVHELRHKRHATNLHKQVGRVLRDGGPYLVCDHFVGYGGMADDDLFMTKEEHLNALQTSGFRDVAQVKVADSLVLFRALR